MEDKEITKKKSRRRPRRKSDKKVTPETQGEQFAETNDVAWYAQTPELLKDAASVPFSYPTGVKTILAEQGATYPGDITLGWPLWSASPGIQALGIIPCPADDGSVTSPINVAATAVYSFVRHANSGRTNYNAPDLMLYCLAMGQVYSYLNFLMRVYGCVNLYSHYNRYIPEALLNAQGVDFDSIYQNLANFRYGVNALINKAASLACPANMPYFQRLAFLFSGIYAEGDTPKDQIYLMYPIGFMKYSETGSTQGGSLQFSKLNDLIDTSYLSYSQLLAYGNALLNPILQSEDMNIMSGDILKAYTSNGILKLQTLSEDYICLPTTDLTVLEQMQNATVLAADNLNLQYSVTQNMTTNTLEATVAGTPQAGYELWGAMSEMTSQKRPLTTILVNPEAGDVMERTRLMTSIDFYTEGSTNIVKVLAATEIAVSLNFWSTIDYSVSVVTGATKMCPAPTSSGKAEPTNVRQIQSILQPDATWNAATCAAAVAQLYVHGLLENFKFHPIIHYVMSDVTAKTIYGTMFAFDLDNYTYLDADTIDRINEAAMLSLFHVPSIAKF